MNRPLEERIRWGEAAIAKKQVAGDPDEEDEGDEEEPEQEEKE